MTADCRFKGQPHACDCKKGACQDDEKIPHLNIYGITADNFEPFRPSDWASRLAGLLCLMEGNRLHYSSCLTVVRFAHGTPGLRVSSRLVDGAPVLFKQVMDFATDNNLVTLWVDHWPANPFYA